MPAKVSNYLRLRYYQYEVTFGLYIMNPAEKFIFNTIILVVFAALLTGLYWEFQPFIVHTWCRVTYYATGSCSSATGLCS